MKTDFLPLPPYLDYRDPKDTQEYEARVDAAIERLESLHRARRWYRAGRKQNVVNLSDMLDAS